jgi:hypothetical protein
MLLRNHDSSLHFKLHIDYVHSVTKMTCKGICVRHKAQKPVGSGRYASGQKRCQICEIFMKWDGLWCPCCGYRLRTKPRNLKYKAKLRAENKSIQSIHPPLIIR